MQILEQTSRGSAPPDPQSLYFRAIPDEVQECTVRRLTLCGLSDTEIAARTGWPVHRVRQLMREYVSVGDALRLTRARGQRRR